MLQSGGGGGSSSGGVREDKVHQLIWRVFTKNNGLTLKAETVAYLKERLGGPGAILNEAELLAALSCIATEYKRGTGRPILVDQRSLADVIESMLKMSVDNDQPSNCEREHGQVAGASSGNGRPTARTYIQTVNASACPRWEHHVSSKSFQNRSQNHDHALIGSARGKIDMYRRHFEIVRQRVLRSEGFSGPNAVRFSSIKSIKGQRLGERRLLLGMLSQMEEGALFLEDFEDFIKLELGAADSAATEPIITPASYTETSMVIVGGIPEGNTLRVLFICPPPIESRQQTLSLATYPNYSVNLFDSTAKFQADEAVYRNSCFLIIADVWLDCFRTMSKFETVISGLTNSPDTIPTAIILQGPFLNPFFTDKNGQHSPAYIRLQTALGNLADMLLKYPALIRQCRLFLQPSSSDPLVPRLEPRLPWPEQLIAPLTRAGINAQILSHPGRLFFFGRELVILGSELSKSLAGTQLIPIAQGEKVSVFRTLLEQSHCCPLPLSMQARAWALDHALTLYPIPNYLIISERSKPNAETVMDCTGLNPGSFATAEYSFILLYPLLGHYEQCKL